MTTACANCGNTAATYCSACGQRQLDGRLTLTELTKTAYGAVVNGERGLYPTLRDLLLRPGKMVSGLQSAGHRKRYFNPFSFFLIVATFQLIDFYLSEDTLITLLRESFEQAAEAQGQPIDADDIQARAQTYYDTMANAGVYAFPLTLMLPYALLLKLFNFRSGFYIAELLAFTVFTCSFAMLFTSLTSPITLSIGFNFYGGFVITCFALMAGWAGVQFFGRWWHAVTTPIAFLIAYAFSSVALALLASLASRF